MVRYEDGHLIFKNLDTGENNIIAVLKKEALLKRWEIIDNELEKIILYGLLSRVYDREGISLYQKFISICKKFDPFQKSLPILSPDQKDALLKIFHSIYQEMTYFHLGDIQQCPDRDLHVKL